MDKSKIYLDLSKCTEEEQKNIFSLLPTDKITAQIYYMIRNSDWEVLKAFGHLFFNENSVWQLCSNRSTKTKNKTEITYPEFIKLFEGGESKEVLQVENIKDIAYTEGVLIGLKICKEMWAQGTISHENIQEEIYHYQEELDNLNSNQ